MCGIAGFCLNPEQHGNATDIAGSMLYDIEHRGYHATGGAWIDRNDNKFKLLKKNLPAHKFVPSVGDTLCSGARSAILHTRWATQGSPLNNDNNHPITRGQIALTHNGHIANDNDLFKRLNVKRRAEVDSEAVTALIAFTADNYHPTEVLGSIEGSASLAWFNYTDSLNTIHLARVNSSPLWIGQTTQGSLAYGSTLEAVRNAGWFMFDEMEWEYEVQEGEYFRVQDGKVLEYTTFQRNLPRSYSLTPNWRAVAYDKQVHTITNKTTLNRKPKHKKGLVPMPF
jgi:glucosamine--fructose-6-phosphate aminotransferase (isomerizing)